MKCLGVLLCLLATVFNAPSRTIPDSGDPLGFFTAVADKLLRSTFPFGITNIPVCANGVYVYTPAMQRLLQLSANIYDAANTNFFPVVFRPLFAKDASNNIFIIGYQQVTNVSGTGDPQLSPPYDVTQLLNYSGAAPIADAHGPVNVYGVPWIIGAKKGLPGFNQLSLVTAVPVTRKLQVTRTTTDPFTATYATNQMYEMSISNSLGISFWNSYTNTYPRPVTVFACDAIFMNLNNSALPIGFTNCYLGSPTGYTIPAWPGSQWNSGPPNAVLKNTASFVVANWSFNFLPPAVYRFGSRAFDVSNGATNIWEATIPPLPQLPQFVLSTTNYLQAFILDGSNVIDYVQLRGPVSTGNLNQALADPDYPDPFHPNTYHQWSTNTYLPYPPTPFGVINQLWVSGHSSDAPVAGGQWSAAPTPMGLTTPPAEAAYFYGLFMPSFQFNGQSYVNNLLAMQAPYTPSRTVFSAFLLQANDPLVHYLASDLNSQFGATAVWAGIAQWQNGVWSRTDDLQTIPLPRPPSNPVGGRYQPWMQKGQMDGLANIITVINNYACKDPLVYGSDNWNFPTNLMSSLVGLGQVHRGTPWQTVYLKDADITKAFLQSSGGYNYIGTNTWMQWTGDFDATDAALMVPVSDRRLSGLLMPLLNMNAATQLFSVSNQHVGDWQNVFNGLIAYSNSSPVVFANSSLRFDTYVLSSNSPQIFVIVNGINGINVTRANTNLFPSRSFLHAADVLAAPALSVNSPFLNLGSTQLGYQQMNYGITDWEYEAIPAQLLLRLRTDSLGMLTPTNGGWNLSFSGADGYDYALQTSTNLVDWNSVSTNSPVQGGFKVPVSPATGSTNQFFRSVLLP